MHCDCNHCYSANEIFNKEEKMIKLAIAADFVKMKINSHTARRMRPHWIRISEVSGFEWYDLLGLFSCFGHYNIAILPQATQLLLYKTILIEVNPGHNPSKQMFQQQKSKNSIPERFSCFLKLTFLINRWRLNTAKRLPNAKMT